MIKMIKGNENFQKNLKEYEETKKLYNEKIEKLKDNSYFSVLLENRKKIHELNKKVYELKSELKKIQNELREMKNKEDFLASLQNWSSPMLINIDSYQYSELEDDRCKYILECWSLLSPLFNIHIYLEEQTDLKNFKFKVFYNIQNIKDSYIGNIISDATKFKNREDALNLVEKLKQELIDKYKEQFDELYNNMQLATEVRKELLELKPKNLDEELKRIIKINY